MQTYELILMNTQNYVNRKMIIWLSCDLLCDAMQFIEHLFESL